MSPGAATTVGPTPSPDGAPDPGIFMRLWNPDAHATDPVRLARRCRFSTEVSTLSGAGISFMAGAIFLDRVSSPTKPLAAATLRGLLAMRTTSSTASFCDAPPVTACAWAVDVTRERTMRDAWKVGHEVFST